MDASPPATIRALLEHDGFLRGLARGLTRDASRADDVAQLAWLRAIESGPPREASARGWFGAVVRNLARDERRGDARRSRREQAAARPERLPAASDAAAVAECHRRLLRAVLDLPEPRRTVVLLRYFEGLPPREIARRLGESPEAVRTRLSRALGELRARLGDRASYLALAPLPLATPLLTEVTIMASKKKAAALVLLLLLGGGAAFVTLLADRQAPPAPPAPAPAESREAAPPAPEPRPSRGRAAPAAEPASEPPSVAPATPPAAPPAPAAPAPRPVRRLTPEVLGPLEPVAPPQGARELKPGEQPVVPEGTRVGGEGGFSSLGWRRFAEPPVRGSTTLRGRVVDSSGQPARGATVFRVSLDETGVRASPSSYQWIQEIATTGDDGRFEAASQPAGTFLVAADWHRLMNRDRGLDLGASARVEFAEGRTVDVPELRLPLDIANLSGVTGRVLDEDGRPVRNAAVWGGRLRREYTDADGRFALRGMTSASVTVSVESTGFARWSREVELRPGADVDVEIRLELASKGPLAIAGRVVDEAGVPAAGVPLFLPLAGRDARWAKSGEDGAFRFDRLPDSTSRTDVKIVVSPHPERDHVLGAAAPPIRAPAENVEIVVTRTADLRIVLRSARTGTPIQQFRTDVAVERAGEPRRPFRSMAPWDEDGIVVVAVPRGRVVLSVEPKGHRGLVFAVDVPDAGEPSEVVLEFEPEGGEPR